MATQRLKVAAAVLVLVGLVGTATALAFRSSPPPDVPPNPEVPTPPTKIADNVPPARPVENPVPAPAPVRRMNVNGVVVGPDGKPVAGAQVSVVAARRRQPGELNSGISTMQLLGDGRADEQGNFRLSVPQTSADHFRLTTVAAAPGCALSGQMADPATATAEARTVAFQLPAGFTVRGRVVDHTGQPARRVQLHVVGLNRAGPTGVFILYHTPPATVPGWPASPTTDDGGDFTLRDMGPDTQITLQARDERYATTWLTLTTGKQERRDPVTLTLSAPRVLEGRVTAEDTGEALVGATVVVETRLPNGIPGHVEAKTDRDGRYRTQPFTGDRHTVWVFPSAEQPYLALRQEVQWPADAKARTEVDLSTPRGVLIRGTVLEAESRRPVAGAAVSYEWAFTNNPFRAARSERRPREQLQLRDARTSADGTFLLVAPPGPGTLLVKAAEPDFIHTETGTGQLLGNAGGGGKPYFPDAVVALTLGANGAAQSPVIELHRGVTVRGRVTGADGKPVASALLISPTYVPDGLEVRGHALPVRDGRFELPGCAPGTKAKVWVFDPKKNEGAVAELTVGGPEPEIRLAPCVSARVRAAGTPGPAPAARMMVELVLRPGDSINDSLRAGSKAYLLVSTSFAFGRDTAPFDSNPGEVVFPRLIPGATYLVRCEGPIAWLEKMRFTAPTTGEHSLGEVTLEPPRRR
jgi:hypothetical protein